jgi:AcrR family transcriptional regulator
MSIPYELVGRTQQKDRTKRALVAAARELVARGVTPTVEDAAAAAGISRTTAYRYFPNQQELLVAAHPEIERRSLLPESPPSDPAERLELAAKAMLEIVLGTEPQQRTMLRLSLEEDPAKRGSLPLRQGRAIRWLEEALAPLRDEMSQSELRRLVFAIRSTIGIEALVWLTDIAGLQRKQAAKLMRWMAGALLRAALEDGPPP